MVFNSTAKRFIVIVCLGLAASSASFGLAQVTPAITPTTGAGGLGTTVTQAGTTYQITGGTRPGDGVNLFHSFGEFGVPTNNIANFLNETALPTTNILGRVTGGNPSNIFGTIQTTGFGSANLFLMNPAGIVFGPNASLNVGGSATFTTADYLRFADSAKFNAAPGPQDALISSAPIVAFGFLGSNPAAIMIQGGQLAVAPSQSLSLVGGNIEVEAGTLLNDTVQPARLAAPGGQINLFSAGSSGEMLLHGTLGQPTEPAVNGFTTLGDISLSAGASIETTANTAGRIVIRGGQFAMDDASIKAISEGGEPSLGRATASPTISITAESIALTNGTHITADSHGTASAGDITFNVGTLTTEGDATNRISLNPTNLPLEPGKGTNWAQNLITSDNRSPAAEAGPAGRITMQGVGGPGTSAASITLKDSAVSSRVFGGTADTTPSAITITADSLVLINEDFPTEQGGGVATIVVTTVGAAPAGDVDLNVNTLRINANPDETPIEGAKRVFVNSSNHAGSTAGPAGNLTISGVGPELTDAAQLVVLNRGVLFTGVDGGSPASRPGSITITADTVSLIGDTGIFANTFGDVQTPAGNIALNVNQLRANVKPVGTLLPGHPASGINSTSEGWQAGTVTISGLSPDNSDSAKLVSLNNVELSTAVAGGRETLIPATITVIADQVRLTDTVIKTDTVGAVPAGNITIKANSIAADQSTKISSNTSATGRGGNVSFDAGQSLTMRGGTHLSAQSTGQGNAGNIAINAGAHFSAQNSTITTEASHTSGGNVVVQATDSIRLVNSRISTSVQGGPETSGGNVTLDPAIVILQNSQVRAEAVEGSGGNINIIAGVFLADPSSVVSASSQFGLSGSVNIQSPVSSLSGSLAVLPQRVLESQPLLQQACASQGSGRLSSLVVSGRDTFPVEPGGWMISPLALLDEARQTLKDQQTTAVPDSPLRTHVVENLNTESHISFPRLTNWLRPCS
jgi:filamentous hemagglutinin family protein